MLPLVSKVYSDISSLKKQLNHAESKLEEQEKEIDDFQDVKEGDKSPQFSMPSMRKVYIQKSFVKFQFSWRASQQFLILS